MAKFTAVYADFSQRLIEVEVLRRQAAQFERSRQSFRHGPEIRALCRGAVVLLSSHIEGYIKELGEHTLDSLHAKSVCRSKFAPQFFYHISQEAIGPIRDSSQPAVIAQHLQTFVSIEAPVWGNVHPLPGPVPSERFNKGFSNPTFDKVKAYFGRFGYTDFRRDFFHHLNKDAQTVVNNLNHIVETRNSIAHGDQSAVKTPLEVGVMVEAAKTFCRATDSVFGTWCKKTLCSIR